MAQDGLRSDQTIILTTVARPAQNPSSDEADKVPILMIAIQPAFNPGSNASKHGEIGANLELSLRL